MPDNVVLIKFEQSAKSYEELSELKRLSGGPLSVGSAAVLARDAAGHLAVKDGFDNESGAGASIGGLIGLFVGILGGPMGVLLGWSGGTLLGAVSDLGDTKERTGVVERVVQAIEPSETAIFAHLLEPDTSFLDNQVSQAGGKLQRWTSADLLNDIYAAREAEEQTAAAARKHYREQRSADRKAKIHAWFASLKQKL